ncbi:MAG UNVERIFIED_CONTAM: hypothetical protein LVT10_01555 [Anaerolineae bacterium]|jgi:hypothetical protein
MTNWLLIVIALVWWVGACVRIFQHIRFFQIEEYMPLRYLRWVFSKTARWLPTRATLALFVGGIVSTFIGDTIWVTGIILVISAAVVIYPYQLAEVKRGSSVPTAPHAFWRVGLGWRCSRWWEWWHGRSIKRSPIGT